MTDKLLPHILWSGPAQEAESDCACAKEIAPPVMVVSQPELTADSDCACARTLPSPATLATHIVWQLPTALYHAPLPQGYTVAFNPAGRGAIAALDAQAQAHVARFAAPHTLTDATDQQLADLGLLTPLVASTESPTPHTLTTWLHLTEACNLRCAYCYVRQGPRAMDETTGRTAVEAVFRSAVAHGYRAVKIKYAGGEPMLVWPLIPKLHAHAQTLAVRNGLELRATVLSNGTLLPEATLGWLIENQVRLMFSLDGIGAVHDAQRRFANGSGSFDVLASNLDRALAAGISPHLSITVTGRNVIELTAIVRYATEHNLTFHLNLSRAPEDVARLNDMAEQSRWLTGLREAITTAITLSPNLRIVDDFFDLTSLAGAHSHPCGAGRDYLVIDPAGRIAQCQMLLERPVTDIWADNPLNEIRLHNDHFSNPSVDDKAECNLCAWRYVCAGGCPLMSRNTYGTAAHSSPYCFLYRELLPEIMYWEGLRLLKSATAKA